MLALEEMKFKLSMIDILITELVERERRIVYSYEVVGKTDEQRKDYRTGDLMWEDEEETIPKYVDKWDWVPKETLSEEDEMKLKVIRNLSKKLMSLANEK